MSATVGCDYSSSAVYLGVTKEDKVLSVVLIHTGEDDLALFVRIGNMLEALDREFKISKYIHIEQPWVNGKFFPKSGLMMARIATYVEIAALAAGFKPCFVHPGTWRGGLFNHKRQPDNKAAAVKFVQDTFDYVLPVMGSTGRGKKFDHNIADALCIAHYGERFCEH